MLIYGNNRFKEAVLIEAMKDQQKQLSFRLRQEENEKKNSVKLKSAIEHNDGLPDLDLDANFRRAEDQRRELQAEKLRFRLKAVDYLGSERKKKITLPYSPLASSSICSSHRPSPNGKYHSAQAYPKANKA